MFSDGGGFFLAPSGSPSRRAISYVFLVDCVGVDESCDTGLVVMSVLALGNNRGGCSAGAGAGVVLPE